MAWLGTENESLPGYARGRAGFARPGAESAEAVRSFLQQVYLFMSVGLAVTGVIAFLVAGSPAALNLVFGNKLVFYGLIIAQLGLVIAFSAVAARVSAGTA